MMEEPLLKRREWENEMGANSLKGIPLELWKIYSQVHMEMKM